MSRTREKYTRPIEIDFTVDVDVCDNCGTKSKVELVPRDEKHHWADQIYNHKTMSRDVTGWVTIKAPNGAQFDLCPACREAAFDGIPRVSEAYHRYDTIGGVDHE